MHGPHTPWSGPQAAARPQQRGAGVGKRVGGWVRQTWVRQGAHAGWERLGDDGGAGWVVLHGKHHRAGWHPCATCIQAAPRV